jgi:hypothetical protein
MVKMDRGKTVKVTGTSYAFTKLKAGPHTVTVQAFNNTGISRTVMSTFTIDTTAPSLSITSPTNGGTVPSSSVTVKWMASDSSGIAYYNVKLDNGAWIKVDATSYTFTGVANGKHTVTVQAVDNAGNTKSVVVKFTVKTLDTR